VREAPLLASICGSSLCCDRFGAPRAGEERPLHGEAGVVEWALDTRASAAAPAVFSASLPLARLVVTRAFALAGAALTLTTRVRADASGGPRAPIEWAEHTTLGGAFLDGARVSARVDAAAEMPAPGDAGAPRALPVADALTVPAHDAPPTGSVRTCRFAAGEESGWEAENAALGWRLRARGGGFPWLCVWTEHRSRTHAPWAGAARARGLEISTKPFPEGAPPADRDATFLGAPSAALAIAEGGEAVRVVELAWERV